MRKLKTTDIPAFCRCLKNIGIQEEIRKIAAEANTGKELWDRGFDLVWNIIDIATEKQSEAHLYAFLAGPFEMTPEQVADLELAEFMKLIKQLATENDLAGFFKSAQSWTR